MADPISLVGLIASIVQLTDAAVKVADYLSDIRAASEERRQLLDEVSHLQSLLEKLKQIQYQQPALLKDPQDSQITSTQQFGETLKECLTRLEKLKKDFKPSLKHWRHLTWSRDKREVKDALATIYRFKTLLDSWLNVDIWNATRRLGEQSDDQGRKTVLQWLSPINFFTRQEDVINLRHPGTGEWLLQATEFKDWMVNTGKVLWCSGDPGIGKTVLSSIVVEHLRKSGPGIRVAVIYCDYKETEIQSPVNMLAGLWRQLTLGYAISQPVNNLYNKCREPGIRPSLNDVVDVLKFEINRDQNSKVFIIVDALDECPEDNNVRTTLLTRLRDLPGIHLMFTSRPSVDIAPFFPKAVYLSIRASDDDIRNYVQKRISEDSALARLLNGHSQLQADITAAVTESADGMFLLARFHMDALATKVTRHDIRDALSTLPKAVDDLYDQIMLRINSRSDNHKHLAHRVLMWATHAVTPLSLEDLRMVVSVKPGTDRIDEDSLPDGQTLLSVCEGLVIVAPQHMSVRLVHLTAHKYFERIRESLFPDAMVDMATACITYLSLNEVPASYREWRFFFCAYDWATYARGIPERRLTTLILKFISNSNRLWLLCPFPPGAYFTSLCIAAYFGFESIVCHLLEERPEVDQKELNSALFAASGKGHTNVVELLLNNDASVDAGHEGYCNALQAALHGNHNQTAKLLLDKGADVNAVAPQVAPDHEHAMELMEEASYGGRNMTALQAASYHGNKQMTKLLLQRGAAVNVQYGVHGTALQLAASKGFREVVQLLIEWGADVNAQCGEYGTALQAAALRGFEEVVKLLFEKGADVGAHCGKYGTALQAAAFGGSGEVVKLLLKSGADVNARCGCYDTALQAAANGGSGEEVGPLLERGVDTNFPCGKYGTALQAAAFTRSEEVVSLLLEKGADVNAQSGTYGTALQAAACRGEGGIVQCLLAHGADVDAQGGQFESAIQAALQSVEFNPWVVWQLLEKGASFDPQRLDYKDFRVVWMFRHQDVVQYLFDVGEDVDGPHVWHDGGSFLDNVIQYPTTTESFVSPRRISTMYDPISLNIKTSSSLQLRSIYGRIMGVVALHNENSSQCNDLIVSTDKSGIGLIISLFNEWSSDGSGGKFRVVVDSTLGGVQIDFRTLPVNSLLEASVRSLSGARIRLPPTYEGTFWLDFDDGTFSLCLINAEDPTGRGRKRTVKRIKRQGFWLGIIYWEPFDSSKQMGWVRIASSSYGSVEVLL